MHTLYKHKTTSFIALLMIMSLPAHANVADLLTGSFAETVARVVFGLGAIGTVISAIVQYMKSDNLPKNEVLLSLIFGALALKWNSIIGTFTSFF
jgi:hypothetical protein